MSRIPNGIPTLSYCRILPTVGAFGQGDIVNDGNAVVVLEPGQPSARFEVAQVVDKNFDDEEACEMMIGQKAGAGLGAVLNPVSAFVNDAANVVIILTGSRNTRKWQFLKRILLPFVANEILSHVADRSQMAGVSMYKAQLTVSALEIQDEIIADLLRPANRGLSIVTNLEEGVMVQGLHRETVTDEMSLRRLLIESCDNRGIQNLPVGGNIDSSTGIFEFRLYQADNVTNQSIPMVGGGQVLQTRECQSRFIIIDLPAIDPLLSPIASNAPEEMRLFAGNTLNKSLVNFFEVAKKLNNPYRAQLAPFRASKLTHYVSELIGGNAIIVSLGHIISGEPQVTKLTLELLSHLNNALHYPLSGREISDTVQGLLTKYRSMLVYSQQEILHNHQSIDEQSSQTQQLQQMIQTLQKELAQTILDKETAIEDRMKVIELLELLKKKYQTILDEKLKQSEILAKKEEEIIELGQVIIQKNLEIVQLKQDYDQQLFDQKQIELQLNMTVESLQKQLQEKDDVIQSQEKEIRLQKEIIEQNQQEILKWKEELMKKTTEYQELKEKNIDLSAELLTLVNQKDVLTKEIETFEKDKLSIQQMKTEYDEKIRGLEVENKQLLQKVIDKDEELLNLRKQMNADATAAAATQLASNKSREKIEKVKSIDSAINNKQENEEGESIDNANVQKGGDIARRMINAMKLSVEEKKEKLLLKQLYDYETKFHRLEYDAQLQKQLLDTVQKENQDLREKYSVKLRDEIEHPSTPLHTLTNNTINDNAMNDALSNLLVHYETIIDNLQQKVVFNHAVKDDCIQHYRELYDHYHIMMDNLEAMSQLFSDYTNIVGRILNRANKESSNTSSTSSLMQDKKLLLESKIKMILDNALKEQFQLSNVKLQEETEWLEERLGQEKVEVMTAKETQKKQMIEEKEKIAAIINTYQRNLQTSEKKNVKLQQDIIDLKVQINQLLTKQHSNNTPQPAVKKEGDDQPETAVPESIDINRSLPVSASNNNAMYESLASEIRELKQLLLQHDNVSGNRDKNPLASLSRRPSSQLIEVLKDVISGKNSGKATPQPPSIPKDTVIGGLASGRATASSLKPLEEEDSLLKPTAGKESLLPLKEGDIIQLPVVASTAPTQPVFAAPPQKAEHPSHLKVQLIEAEEKVAQLSSKQVALEEELRSYQNYMKEIIPQYQKQIKALQQKQKQAQQKAQAATATTTSAADDAVIKLPAISK